MSTYVINSRKDLISSRISSIPLAMMGLAPGSIGFALGGGGFGFDAGVGVGLLGG